MPSLSGERLEQDRHQVGDQDDAEQRVAEPRAAGEVGGPVARIHVADGDQVARARRRRAPSARTTRRAELRIAVVRLGQARQRARDTASRRAPRRGGSRRRSSARRSDAQSTTCASSCTDDVPLTGRLDRDRAAERLAVAQRHHDARHEAERRRDSEAARARRSSTRRISTVSPTGDVGEGRATRAHGWSRRHSGIGSP